MTAARVGYATDKYVILKNLCRSETLAGNSGVEWKGRLGHGWTDYFSKGQEKSEIGKYSFLNRKIEDWGNFPARVSGENPLSERKCKTLSSENILLPVRAKLFKYLYLMSSK